MEPVRLLRERQIEPHLYFANPNIAPADEYQQRRDTISAWAATEQLALTEGAYDPDAWEATAGRIGDAAAPGNEQQRQARCRACYRLRFETAVAHARQHGFDALGTTLSVSPYQYTRIIEEELERACQRAGIAPFFEDYSPHYAQATRRSRDAGLYRQNYCGCRFSDAEAQAERKARARAREEERAKRAAARAPEEARLQARRAQRAAYDTKQAHKRAVLKELRAQRKDRPDA